MFALSPVFFLRNKYIKLMKKILYKKIYLLVKK